MTDTPNGFSQLIANGNGLLTQDNWAKGLFTIKNVIARLVKACLPDFAPFPEETIANECLDDFQDKTGQFHSEFAKGLPPQRPLPNGAQMDCDLLFELHPPNCMIGKLSSQLLNIEVQNDSRQLDRCIGRGMLYASGLYYMEYGAIYTYPRFEDSWPVNSIWVCPTAPLHRQGTLLDFRTTVNCKPNSAYCLSPQSYDKIRLTFLNVSSDSGLGKKDIFGFIWALMTASLSPEDRKRILQEEFNMQMTQPIEETIDKYELFLDLYGRKRYADEMQRNRMEGIAEEREIIALNMLKDKFHIEVIARITGLSLEDIIQLAQDNNLSI
ncbi:MAG: hypothetical protein IKZ46_02325 [Victivallales bacterium]|nr:hypothetical protein [Victivallales bacterium]